MNRTPLLIGFMSLCSLASTALCDDAGDHVDFNRDVRPILSENCYQCHGPDANRRKGKLRLDVKEDAFRDRGGRAVVAPAKPEDSELLERIAAAADDETKMPPPGAGKPLSAAQIETLRRWIAEGAEWKGHWAFESPTRARTPAEKDAGFVKTDIDRFILARLRERGLKPSPEADKITLIRRLSFDLTGLPPSPDDVRAFVLDSRGDAYERLVDQMLASPRYGERMAMAWLDLVRYADTTGFHGDNHRDIWMFRDYVIRSFNDDKPFDRFTIEQLAGDLLPNPSADERIASGYNRLLMTTQEGGAQPKEYAAKYMADRVRNASSVWLGVTLGCAECHDHKFDPLTTKEFYSFAAFFADVKETPVGVQEQTPFPTPEQAAEESRIQAQTAAVKARLDRQSPELDKELAEWEASLTQGQIEWRTAKPDSTTSEKGATLTIQADGALVATGVGADKDTYTVVVPSDQSNLTGIRLEVLPDDGLPSKGPGRASNGNFVLHELEASRGGNRIKLKSATATHSQDNYPIAAAIDGKPETGWAILPSTGQANEAVFELSSDLRDDAGPLTITLKQNYGEQHVLGKFRVSFTSSPRPIHVEGSRGLPRPIQDILAVEPAKRAEGQKTELAAYHRSVAASLDAARKELAALKTELDAVRAKMPRTLITLTTTPPVMRVLPRGNWLDDSGTPVEPATPAAVSPTLKLERRANRLDLARWMTAKENPLVARVIVNRLWKIAFGRGLVASAEDFGSQGAWPTHPHLLDWLAVEFRESGWDVKKMLRLMVTSGVYRQSSACDAAVRAADPDNLWLARQSRFRLDAEMVRDNALAVSGLLQSQVGGPSARPYQPPGYWSHLNFPKREYQVDQGDGLYRRGLYTYWCRTFLHPSLLAFDAPTREECQVQRPRSNTPLQALVLLNDPTYVEAARAFAERIVREGGPDDRSKARFGVQLALSREAKPVEIDKLLALKRDHLSQFQTDRDAAKQLMRVGERPAAAGLDEAELAAWTSVARVIFNLHETMTRN
jgi:Protein of unknown function (DUF1553)/Protein of unknown function (DUF1549)/Planctomycete cytochrome C